MSLSNEQFIEQSMRVGRAARARMARTHPGMTKTELDVAAHEAEIAYLVAVKDVFRSISSFALRAPGGPN